MAEATPDRIMTVAAVVRLAPRRRYCWKAKPAETAGASSTIAVTARLHLAPCEYFASYELLTWSPALGNVICTAHADACCGNKTSGGRGLVHDSLAGDVATAVGTGGEPHCSSGR